MLWVVVVLRFYGPVNPMGSICCGYSLDLGTSTNKDPQHVLVRNKKNSLGAPLMKSYMSFIMRKGLCSSDQGYLCLSMFVNIFYNIQQFYKTGNNNPDHTV